MEVCAEMIEDDELMKVNGGQNIPGDRNTDNNGNENGEDDDQKRPGFVPNHHGMIMIQQ
ncbi:MAG: hypothetical protein K6E68_04965 [Lachnospiraceae bacterium]|nr:hypothetical protein [Lachnospiraceae bacterium]